MESAKHDEHATDINSLIDRGELQKAYEAGLPLAKAGNVTAQMTIGWMYQVGKGVKQDFEQAKYWYRLAAASSPRAEFYLGTVYWNESAFREAVEWFTKAASHGFAPAAYQLARMYRHGVGLPRDQAQAQKYVEEAARGGHLFARRDLARDMLKGRSGVSNIPLGLLRLVRLGWTTLRTASRNIEDDRLVRL